MKEGGQRGTVSKSCEEKALRELEKRLSKRVVPLHQRKVRQTSFYVCFFFFWGGGGGDSKRADVCRSPGSVWVCLSLTLQSLLRYPPLNC